LSISKQLFKTCFKVFLFFLKTRFHSSVNVFFTSMLKTKGLFGFGAQSATESITSPSVVDCNKFSHCLHSDNASPQPW